MRKPRIGLLGMMIEGYEPPIGKSRIPFIWIICGNNCENVKLAPQNDSPSV